MYDLCDLFCFYDTNSIQLSDNIKDNIELSCFESYKIQKNNEKSEKKNIISEENYVNDEDDNFDEVVLLSFNIKTDNVKIHNFQDKGFSMNILDVCL